MSFQHEALFYAGTDDFLAGTVPFIREGVAAGEPVLVAVGAANTARLRAHLGPAAKQVEFVRMAELGRNPARILPAWQSFVARHRADGGRPVRGIGEPAWPGRTDAEICECHRHEALLNVAFADVPEFRLLCPYDVIGLDPEVMVQARVTHPVVSEHGLPLDSGAYLGPDAWSGPFHGDLPSPPVVPETMAVTLEGLPVLRDFVGRHAVAAGMGGDRLTDLLLAVTELATNTIRHGGGGGTVECWVEDDSVLFEVAGGGLLADPLIGRTNPRDGAIGGWGLWLVNQVCDLVQIRSGPRGTVVRVQMAVA